MKRITEHGGHYCDDCSDSYKGKDKSNCNCTHEIAMYNLLSKYEDTGLTPQEINTMQNMNIYPDRLTQRLPDGRASLILDSPQNADEAKKQVHDKFLLAVEKLAKYEDLGPPREFKAITKLWLRTGQTEEVTEEHDEK